MTLSISQMNNKPDELFPRLLLTAHTSNVFGPPNALYQVIRSLLLTPFNLGMRIT